MSAIVIQELAAGSSDSKRLKELELSAKEYEKEGRLLIPNGEDWWFAGKILNLLSRNMSAGGRTARMSKAEQQRILRDVLIARTAKREGVAIITSNLRDFEKIGKYCNVKTLHPRDFF